MQPEIAQYFKQCSTAADCEKVHLHLIEHGKMYNFHILSKHTTNSIISCIIHENWRFNVLILLITYMLFFSSLMSYYNFSILAVISSCFSFIHHLMAQFAYVYWIEIQSEWYWYRLWCSSANYYEMRFSAINFSSSIVVIDINSTPVHKICIFINFVSFPKKTPILSKFAK